ncbi:hypothetical protein KGQ71_00835 [Patescibacteria group bacterium]|nr:hypothetical protein [Patescibacteria group bacterium]
MKLITWFVTWDSGILTVLGLLLAYTLLIRRHKALATLISVYIGYVMATIWSDQIVQFFAGDRVVFNSLWIKANASPFLIQTLVMIILTILLSSFLKLNGKRSKYSVVEVVLYVLFSVAVALVFMLSFMPQPMHEQVLAASHILPYIDRYRELIISLPALLIIFFGVYTDDN